MPEDTEKTITVTQPDMEVTSETEPVCHTIQEYVLYKLDRTLAIVGIVGIAIVALFIYAGAEGVQIATGAIGGLVGYVGGRTGK